MKIFEQKLKLLLFKEEITDLHFGYYLFAGHFCWQIALVIQKPLELGHKGTLLILGILVCLAGHILVLSSYVTAEAGLLIISQSFAFFGLFYCLLVRIFTHFLFR
jgi:hypothetical protein